MEETKVTQAAHEAERKTVRRTMPTQMSRLRVFANSPAPHFESGFGRIAETRMKGLPILNPRIRVKADNFRRWGNDWIGHGDDAVGGHRGLCLRVSRELGRRAGGRSPPRSSCRR